LLRGDGEVIGKQKNKKTIATFQWLSREEQGVYSVQLSQEAILKVALQCLEEGAK